MKFSVWTQFGARNSVPVFEAFIRSINRLGHTVLLNEHGGNYNVIWSVLWYGRMRPNQQLFNSNAIVLEVGGLKRNITWKVALGGINRDAYFGPPNNDDTRVRKLNLSLREWNPKKNGAIVLCTQNPYSQQWVGQPPMINWVSNTINQVRQYTDRTIILRSHPRAKISNLENKFDNVIRRDPLFIKGSYDDFDYDPTQAWAVINWSSNPSTQAIINGIPAFTGPTSLAYPVSNHDFSMIEKPLMPCRKQWLNDIAYTEWTIDEISQGEPLSRLTFKS